MTKYGVKCFKNTR